MQELLRKENLLPFVGRYDFANDAFRHDRTHSKISCVKGKLAALAGRGSGVDATPAHNPHPCGSGGKYKHQGGRLGDRIDSTGSNTDAVALAQGSGGEVRPIVQRCRPMACNSNPIPTYVRFRCAKPPHAHRGTKQRQQIPAVPCHKCHRHNFRTQQLHRPE